MPWNRTDPAKERLKFVLEWEERWQAGEGRVNLSELCRELGISRETAYVWLRRYRESGHDVEALVERSHRPHHIPNQVPQAIADVLVAARKYRPTWGPRKLRAHLIARNPGTSFPSESAIAAILQRNGLTQLSRRRRRRLVVPATRPFAAATGPNAVWCVDFKGWFRTRDGQRCYPLTLLDAYSRYLLRCEALVDPDTRNVEPLFDSAFQEFGTPEAIRSDNGRPFASTGAGGLTALSVWWQRLGSGTTASRRGNRSRTAARSASTVRWPSSPSTPNATSAPSSARLTGSGTSTTKSVRMRRSGSSRPTVRMLLRRVATRGPWSGSRTTRTPGSGSTATGTSAGSVVARSSRPRWCTRTSSSTRTPPRVSAGRSAGAPAGDTSCWAGSTSAAQTVASSCRRGVVARLSESGRIAGGGEPDRCGRRA